MVDPIKYYVDIDNTVFSTPGMDYESAEPILERVKKINELYDAGHTVVMYTARGSVTGIDHRQLTLSQLDSCGIKYHRLLMGKPPFDILIDDKAINSERFFRNVG